MNDTWSIDSVRSRKKNVKENKIMGLSCKKQTGKFKSIMRKMENELEKEKRLAKDRKEAKKNKTSK